MSKIDEVKKILNLIWQDASKWGEAGFWECIASGMKTIAIAQDAHTRSELAKAVKEIENSLKCSECDNDDLGCCGCGDDKFNEALQAVLKLLE